MQLLRAINFHKNTLQYLYMIASWNNTGKPCSYDQREHACKIIKKYLPDINIIFEKADFEDLEQLTKLTFDAINNLKKRELKESEIIIDVTGGQKIPSIAGAVVTLNTDVVFQYIQTQEPYEIIAYNVDIQTPVSM